MNIKRQNVVSIVFIVLISFVTNECFASNNDFGFLKSFFNILQKNISAKDALDNTDKPYVLNNSQPVFIGPEAESETIRRSLALDPYKKSNIEPLLAVFASVSGYEDEKIIGRRLFQGLFYLAPDMKELWKIYLSISRLGNRPEQLSYINLDNNIASLTSFLKTASPKEIEEATLDRLPIPLLPLSILEYAKIQNRSGNKFLAREALERLTTLKVIGMQNETELIELRKDAPRPDLSLILPGRSSSDISAIGIGMANTSIDDKEIKFGIFDYLSFARQNRVYKANNLLIPEDLIIRLVNLAKNSESVNLMPRFLGKTCFMLIASLEDKSTISFFGAAGDNYSEGAFFAILDGKVKILDNPDSYWALNCILRSIDFFKRLEKWQNRERKVLNTISLTSSSSHSRKAEMADEIISFIYQAGAPDMEPIEYEGLQWVSTATDTPGYSFSWMRGRHGVDNEIPEAAPKMLEITRKIRERLAAVVGELPAGCHVNGITGDESINREPPEDRWLRAWSIRHGLPVGNELRKLLRLYKIIGAPLPDRISLRMPLLFRANFVNPRRPEGEHDMISGYWFDELELLVIADFDTDAGSPLGRFAAESVGLKGELAADNARIVLYDGFNFKNHGLRLAIPADHKAGDKIAAEVDKHQIKPAEDSMMLENPEAFRFYASISDQVYFILSEKGKPLQMRFEPEPER